MKISIILISSLLLTTHISALNHKTLIESAEFVLNTFGNKSIKTEYNWRDLSPALHEISIHGHSLPVETQNQLELIGFNFSGKIVNRTLDLRSEANDLDQTYDIGIFRFHYTTIDTIIHAVDETDNNSNSIPDYIDIMAETFVHIYNEQINVMGYYRPPGDAWISNYGGDPDYGGSNHYDVYIRRLSSSYYGYVQSEYTAQNTGNNEFSPNVNEQNAFTSYMAMRNNYNGFPNTEIENIQVTAAHEFFHAIQYGYDGYEKPWLLESTAVWMEEEIYDDINDCYQYMYSWFNEPQKSLDHVGGTHWYGSWIFFEYIDEHFGGSDMIENIFDVGVNTNSQNGDYSHEAIDDALSSIGSSFQEALNGMCIANIVMSSNPGNDAEIYSYEEAEDFPVDGPAIYNTVNFSEKDQFEYIESTTLKKYGSQYIRINNDVPAIVTVDTDNGSPLEFGFHSLIKLSNTEYEIYSGDSLKFYYTSDEVESNYIIIVGQDDTNNNFNYILSIERPNAPGQFNLLSPVNEQLINNNLYPEFIWTESIDSDSSDVINYVLEIGTNIEWLEEIFVGMDTSYVPTVALNENIIYYWQVYAYDPDENKTYANNSYFKFAIQEDIPPEEFSILFPQNDTTLNTSYPTFSWSSSNINNLLDSTYYVLLLGETYEKLDTIYVGTDTLFTITSALVDGNSYYWCVYAKDLANNTTYNTDGIYNFIIDTPPKTFQLYQPINDTTINETNPSFVWMSTKDASLIGYQLLLGNNPEHYDTVNVGQDTSYTPEIALFENIIYHWQVYAYDFSNNRTYNKNGSHSFLIRSSNYDPEKNLTFTNAYPNPFPSERYSIESIRFSFFIEEYDESVKITVFDLLGRRVTDIFNGILEPGFYDHLSWNGYNKKGNLASSGIYFLIIETEAGITNQKITLLR